MLRSAPRSVVPLLLLRLAVAQQGPLADLDALLTPDPAQPVAARFAALREFAARPEAPTAIAPLLDRIRTAAGRLDNDGCLLLEQVLRAHPAARCAFEPLLEVLARPAWNGRQKAAQALAVALRDGTGLTDGDRRRVAAAVIPLLVSQRSRVRDAAAACLRPLAGDDFGGDAERARRWFHGTFGGGIDLVAAATERLVLVRPLGEGKAAVDGTEVADAAALTEAVRAAAAAAAADGLAPGAVVHGDGVALTALLERGDPSALQPVLAAIAAGGVTDVTIAPPQDRFFAPFVDDDVPAELPARLAGKLAELRGRRVPGAQAALVLPHGALVVCTDGLAEVEPPQPMPADGRLLAGSVGKTFFAALAMQLVREGRLELDAEVARWFADEPWFVRLPHGAEITVRHLLRHQSGLGRYEFDPGFVRSLRERPDHVFTLAEQIEFVLGQEPRHRPGAGFTYADTNYVLLAALLERITGTPCYDEIRRRFLLPLRLSGTVPSVGRSIPRLVQGHTADNDPFAGGGRMLTGGRLPFDPGFEGGGGGFASTAADLARWVVALHAGTVLTGVHATAIDGVPAPFGRDARYGCGVMIEATGHGAAFGHDGYFPGWMATMRYWPELGIGGAVMVNSSADGRLGRELARWLEALAVLAAGR